MTMDEMYELRERMNEEAERRKIISKPEKHRPSWALERDETGQVTQMGLIGWNCTWGKWCTGKRP